MTEPSSYAFQWKSGSSNATGPGAATETYTTVEADVGNELTCVVTATNSAGSASVTSGATPAITTSAPPTAQNIPANRLFGFVSPGTENQTSAASGTVAAWQTLYGRNPDIIQTYLEWAGGTAAIQTVSSYQLADWGDRMPLLTVQPSGNPASASTPSDICVNWQDMIAGDYDTEIEAFGSWINSNIGRTTYIRFAHEMNGSWYAWDVNGSNGSQVFNCGVTSPANYVAGFNHFASVLKAASSYVQMVWCPNHTGTNPIADFYPSGCDIMGFDAYNEPDPWQSDTTLFSTPYSQVAACNSTKPIWVCETACGEPASDDSGDTKAAWITALLNNTAFPRIAALVWFDIQYNTTNENYIMNSDTAAVTAFYNAFANSRSGAVYT
jgi:mannan endo-1,4-beta-mannosidase